MLEMCASAMLQTETVRLPQDTGSTTAAGFAITIPRSLVYFIGITTVEYYNICPRISLIGPRIAIVARHPIRPMLATSYIILGIGFMDKVYLRSVIGGVWSTMGVNAHLEDRAGAGTDGK